MCFGSEPGTQPPDAGGVATLDRHEVAHVVLNEFTTPDMEPPAILMEGWADTASMLDMASHRLRAWSQRDQGDVLPLAELVGPAWYSRHDRPVYIQGSTLVDYLLRHHGADRFVELYATSHPTTFAADCQRVLGVTVDELDRACWADLDAHAGPGGYPELWLRSLRLGPAVKAADWDEFVTRHLAATNRLLEPYQQVRLTAESVHTSDREGKVNRTTWRFEFLRSGMLRALHQVFSENFEELYIAHPEHSIRADRKTARDPWQVRVYPRISRDADYRTVAHHIDMFELVTGATAPLISQALVSTSLADPLSMEVTRLRRFEEKRRAFYDVELEADPPGNPQFRRISLQVAADDHTVAHDESEGREGNVWKTDAVYSAGGSLPLLQSMLGKGRWKDGTTATTEVHVIDRKFGPVPESEFTLEHLIGNAPVHRVVRESDADGASSPLRWFLLPIVLGTASLGAGAALALLAPERGVSL
jgi:hypothetical protein